MRSLPLPLLTAPLRMPEGLTAPRNPPPVAASGIPPARHARLPGPEAAGGALPEAKRPRVAGREPICIDPAPVSWRLDLTWRRKPAGDVAARRRTPDTCHPLGPDAAENHRRPYRGTGGRRARPAGQEGLRIARGAWHILRLRREGEGWMAWLDGAPVPAGRGVRPDIINSQMRIGVTR